MRACSAVFFFTQPYTGLRALYLESNAISIIQGLDALTSLRSLFLAHNLVASLQPLAPLTQLEVLDVSHNRVASCQGLSSLSCLRSLNLAGNRLASAADLAPLAACTSLVTLDLSNNQLVGGDGVLRCLTEAPWELALLRLQGNPLVAETRCGRLAGWPVVQHTHDP